MEDGLDTGLREAGIERRNLIALGIGCAALALAGVFGLKIVALVVKRALNWMLGINFLEYLGQHGQNNEDGFN